MKDFVLGDDFLKTCVDLPEEIRETIVSQLRAYSRNPRSRDLVIEGIEGTRNVLSLPVDGTYRILLRREKPFTSLICVTGSSVPPNPAASKHRSSDETQFAPVDSLESLLVEEKYLPLAIHLLQASADLRALEFQFLEIEKILNTHLPPEARQFLSWWANQKSGKRPQAFAWMAAGWLTSKVDIKADLVTFIRRPRT